MFSLIVYTHMVVCIALYCILASPFFLIAGQFDDASSMAFIQSSGVYAEKPDHLGFFHHATGHRPTPESLAAAYDFFDRFLK